MNRYAWPAAVALIGAALSGPAPAVEVRRIDGVPLVTGGVGSDEVDEMTLALPDYNLKVTAAARRSGAFLADVALEVRDARGVRVLSVTLEGPILLTRLPAGTYELRLTYRAKTQTRSVSVPPQGRRETVFYWDVPESDDPRPSPAERAQPAR
ncbi:MAG TPA: carboxypeptidase regulatory-like domain-containing protein [Burkholderiales bacterium]|nr:carboxypeptidase regulatory-like domain-containing protein [Burkholderiales bacterium]